MRITQSASHVTSAPREQRASGQIVKHVNVELPAVGAPVSRDRASAYGQQR